MRKRCKKMAAVLAVAAAALLIWQHEAIWAKQEKPRIAQRPQRQVLRLWVCEEWMGSAAWLEAQCAAFERAHTGVSLRIRRVQPSELTAPDAVLPDVLLFAPGALAEPEALLLPVRGALPVRAELAAAGRWRGEQWGVPVAMGGYALLVNAEGYRDPETTALSQEAMEAAAQTAKGKQPAKHALQCAQGGALAYPAALLAQGGALRGGWPQGIAQARGGKTLPEDFARCTPDKAYGDFTGRRAMALLGTQRDLRRFSALCEAGKGFPFRVEAPKQAFTDQLLFAGVVRAGERSDATMALCAALLRHLTGGEAQQALTAQGLFPVRADVIGYDAEATPWLHAMAASLADEGVLVPNAFTWAQRREPFLSRSEAALSQGGIDLALDLWREESM